MDEPCNVFSWGFQILDHNVLFFFPKKFCQWFSRTLWNHEGMRPSTISTETLHLRTSLSAWLFPLPCSFRISGHKVFWGANCASLLCIYSLLCHLIVTTRFTLLTADRIPLLLCMKGTKTEMGDSGIGEKKRKQNVYPQLHSPESSCFIHSPEREDKVLLSVINMNGWELLTRRCPFQGKKKTAGAQKEHLLREDILELDLR